MRAVTGPLETGTYVAQLVNHPGEFATATKGKEKFHLTKDPQSTGVKWHLERIGDDLFRCKHTALNVSPSLSGQDMEVSMSEGVSNWIIKEADVKGEYYGAPAEHPTLFVSATKDESDLQLNVGSGMSRVNLFYADD